MLSGVYWCKIYLIDFQLFNLVDDSVAVAKLFYLFIYLLVSVMCVLARDFMFRSWFQPLSSPFKKKTHNTAGNSSGLRRDS